MPRCKECKTFDLCDRTLFKATGKHLIDREHKCMEYQPGLRGETKIITTIDDAEFMFVTDKNELAKPEE